jgi:hypothetical protein
MKRILIAGTVTVFAVWIAHSVGYRQGFHEGVREERHAWEAARIDLDQPVRDQPMRKIPVTLDNEPAHMAVVRAWDHTYYKNPHSHIIEIATGPATVNVPDPRNFPNGLAVPPPTQPDSP